MEKNTSPKGYLVPIGGAEDRKDEQTILKRIVNLNHAQTILIIPTATSYPAETIRTYQDVFKALGVQHVEGLDIRYRDEADRDYYVEMLDKADAVFFTGGNQVKLVEILKGSKVLKKIWERYCQGMTIAGTSAGAAAVSDPMIYDGDEDGLSKSSVKQMEGFGFLKNITIDTHFIERGRIPRLSQFLASGQSCKGVGLAEDTAVVIAPDHTFEVVGSRVVTVLNSEKVSYTNYHEIEEKSHIAINGVNLGFLPHGVKFDLETWEIVENNGKSSQTDTFRLTKFQEESYVQPCFDFEE